MRIKLYRLICLFDWRSSVFFLFRVFPSFLSVVFSAVCFVSPGAFIFLYIIVTTDSTLIKTTGTGLKHTVIQWASYFISWKSVSSSICHEKRHERIFMKFARLDMTQGKIWSILRMGRHLTPWIQGLFFYFLDPLVVSNIMKKKLGERIFAKSIYIY